MANKRVFGSGRVSKAPTADSINAAGGVAYSMSPKHALAQLAHTGTFSDQFYTSGQDQLDTMKSMLDHEDVSPKFVGQLAIYARQRGYMKDMPSFLCAWLTTQGDEGRDVLGRVFSLVIDNGRMLRNFVQMKRSGVFGSKSMGSFSKRLVQNWLTNSKPWSVFRASVGNDPSMADIIKMAHPKPTTKEEAATFAYLIGKEHKAEDLPQLIRDYEAWKIDNTRPVPKVPFQMVTQDKLTTDQWRQICENGGWHFIRMNLNTFKRHGVLDNMEMVQFIANKLRDREAIETAKVFPYQLLAAYKFATDIPHKIRQALHDSMDIAIERVPEIGRVIICCDTSYSMVGAAVTGQRGGGTSKVMAIDVAGLMSSVILRRNPESRVIHFATGACEMKLDPSDTVMTNAKKLADIGGGGTNCSAALELANQKKWNADAVVYISDNESWIETAGLSAPRNRYSYWRGGATGTMEQWEVFRARNKSAKLINIDTCANVSTQVSERGDIMNIGGFSDQVFEVAKEFIDGEYGAGAWLATIESVKI
jgi:60 kDa SS-A/Ro ribonucleoprotein